MEIKLKNLKIYEGMSEETTAFVADVYVNGKKVAHAKNDGHGGNTFYRHNTSEDAKIVAQAEEYCKTLPSTFWEHGGKTHELKQSLESVIDDLVNDEYNKKVAAKDKKKLERNMIKGLCYGTPEHYTIISWKGVTIPQMMLSANGRGVLQAKILELQSKGERILKIYPFFFWLFRKIILSLHHEKKTTTIR